LLATGSSDKTVILWDLSDPTRPARAGTLIGDGREVYAVAFGLDGRLLVTGSGTTHSVSGTYVSHSDGVVGLWNLADRSHPDRVDTFTLARSANDGKVHAVAFSPDGRLIATTGDPGTAVLWDVSDASRLTRAATLGVAKWYESIVYALAFSPGGRLLATGRNDKTVILWEISDPWHPTRIAAFRASDRRFSVVYSLAFSPDGRLLATGSGDKTVILWDLANPSQPRRIATVAKHRRTVKAIQFSPDGRLLAAAGNDGIVRPWSTS
jgi:WD40 repeat protein